jgi:hypothetical protein
MTRIELLKELNGIAHDVIYDGFVPSDEVRVRQLLQEYITERGSSSILNDKVVMGIVRRIQRG